MVDGSVLDTYRRGSTIIPLMLHAVYTFWWQLFFSMFFYACHDNKTTTTGSFEYVIDRTAHKVANKRKLPLYIHTNK